MSLLDSKNKATGVEPGALFLLDCETQKGLFAIRSRRASLSTACVQQVVSPVRTWTWLAPYEENFDSQQPAKGRFCRSARNEYFGA
jgi:hypothetical protein